MTRSEVCAAGNTRLTYHRTGLIIFEVICLRVIKALNIVLIVTCASGHFLQNVIDGLQFCQKFYKKFEKCLNDDETLTF